MSSDLPVARLEPALRAAALRGDLPLTGPMPATRPHPGTPGDLLRALDAALPRGAPVLLSGGLDSSVLLALAGGEAVVLDDPWVDAEESGWAGVMVERTGATRHTVCLGAEALLAGWAEAVVAVGLPLYNARAVSRVLLLRELGAAGVHRVVSGVGADEIFAPDPAPGPLASEEWWAEQVAGPALPVRRTRLGHDVCVAQLPLDRAGRRWGVEVVHPYLTPEVRERAAALQDPPDGPPKQALRQVAPVPVGLRERRKRPVLATAGDPRWIERLRDHVDHPPLVDAWRSGDPGAERVAWRLACWRLLEGACAASPG